MGEVDLSKGGYPMGLDPVLDRVVNDDQRTQATLFVDGVIREAGNQYAEEQLPIATTQWREWNESITEPLRGEWTKFDKWNARQTKNYQSMQVPLEIVHEGLASNTGVRLYFYAGTALGTAMRQLQYVDDLTKRTEGAPIFEPFNHNVGELVRDLGVPVVPTKRSRFGRYHDCVMPEDMHNRVSTNFEDLRRTVVPHRIGFSIGGSSTVNDQLATVRDPNVKDPYGEYLPDPFRYGLAYDILQRFDKAQLAQAARGTISRDFLLTAIHEHAAKDLDEAERKRRLTDYMFEAIVKSDFYKGVIESGQYAE